MWRRWHISLSTWFRDYVYIPLGGNRLGIGRGSVNMMATMLFSGLWHGADWTFVLWGGLLGIFLLVNRLFHGSWERVPRFIAVPVVGVFVFAAWAPFRADSVGNMLQVYFAFAHGGFQLPPFAFVVGFVGIGLLDLFRNRFRSGEEIAHRPLEHGVRADTVPAAAVWMAAAILAGCMQWFFWGADIQPFIYFKF
jgi:alginate O-acetyltransferase complex protein AlgI